MALHSRKLALIANLASRNHQDQSRFDQYVLDTLEKQQIQVILYKTINLEDLENAVKDCLEAEIKEFVAIGGDGSLHHLINQLFAHTDDITQIKLAIIPKGTGNDYIRNFNFKSKREIIESILSEKYTQVDLGCLHYSGGQHYFINMLGIGFSAAVVKNLIKYKWLGGLSYYFALIETFFRYQSQDISIELDGKTYQYSCFQLSIGIGKYAGHNMKLCPNAVINDGLLDVNIIEKVSLWELIRYLHTLKDGSYLQHIPSRSFQAKEVKLLNVSYLNCEADGEDIACPKKVTIFRKRILMPTAAN